MEENIIEVRGLTKIYEEGNVLAVDNIDFNIKKGEIFALLGPNGAGKTTTISMLSTLLTPTKGTAIVNNFDVCKEPHKVRKSIGLVFQEPSLDTELKGWENLELHGILYKIPKKERRKRIEEVLKLVDLEDKADIFVKNYSGGMKRRLEIARGLLHRPKVLFLDEPTLGLDPQTRRKIWDKIKELNQGELQMTILITTHYMDEADELADRICIMDHGKIIAMDTSENLKKRISGEIIEIEFEKDVEEVKLGQLIPQIKSIPGVRKISLGNSKKKKSNLQLSFPMPKGMPNMNPEMMRSKMQEIMSDPKKLVKAIKRFPMASQFFNNAPIEVKERIAQVINDDLIKELPEEMQKIIIEIKNGKIEGENLDLEPIISISCEDGGKQIIDIIQTINENNLKVKSVHLHAPSLEDVFLFYVGKEIRDEGADRTSNIKKFIQMKQLRR